jgi:hypothetical protein
MWREDPEERPNFKEIVLSLAELTHYSGDIESELLAETRNCKRLKEEHNYHDLELTAHYEMESEGATYAVLEEPVYHNCSRDESLDSPEEYEVPQPVLTVLTFSNGVLDSYEAPAPSLPLDYEEPSTLNGRCVKNSGPDTGLCSPPKFPTQDRRVSAPSVTTRTSRCDRSHRSQSVGVVAINNTNRDSEAMEHKTRTERAVSPGYLKLKYPAMQRASSAAVPSGSAVSTTDKPYSTLEWNKSDYCRSLPHRSTNHLYQTLEYEAHSQ